MNNKLSHINKKGEANMVDVGQKPEMNRIAKASGKILLQESTIRQIKENNLKKGDVFSVARIAGIQAAKQTAMLIPLCHPLALTKIDVQISLEKNCARVHSEVRCTGKTGVEMEALTAVSVCLLTIYDMCKAIDKSMIIQDLKLEEKLKQEIPEQDD